MKTKIAVFLVILPILLIGCSSRDQKASAKIAFEIKEFNMKYDDGEYSKSYTGEGSILAVGDAETVRKPHLVFVKYEKTKGGDSTEEKKGVKTIEVVDGIGKITTYDATRKKSDKLEKPEYKFEVVGYIPLIPLKPDASKNSKVSFDLKDFQVEYKEKVVASSYISYLGSLKMIENSYTGKGTIIVTGDQEVVKRPYVVILRLERTKGGRETDTDTKNLQSIAIIDGIGKFYTYDFTLRSTVFGKEISSKKLEKPEYKIEILGYKQAEG